MCLLVGARHVGCWRPASQAIVRPAWSMFHSKQALRAASGHTPMQSRACCIQACVYAALIWASVTLYLIARAAVSADVALARMTRRVAPLWRKPGEVSTFHGKHCGLPRASPHGVQRGGDIVVALGGPRSPALTSRALYTRRGSPSIAQHGKLSRQCSLAACLASQGTDRPAGPLRDGRRVIQQTMQMLRCAEWRHTRQSRQRSSA